jgi:RNA-directed DNA polymerase
MGKKHKHLYDTITSEQSLQAAYHRAATGKRQSHGYLVFNEYAQVRLIAIRQQLLDESWQPSPLREFTIYEPKPRLIGAPTFADRVVHHALCAVIEPIFDKAFLPYSFACRRGLGTHAGVVFLQSHLRTGRYTHYLKTDFRKFFPSIDRAILSQEFRRKITCPRTVALFEKIVPPTGVGVPIGALTSQLSANIYGNILDQHLHHYHRVRFARYMDDVVILGTDPRQLRALKDEVATFAQDRMRMGISRWRVASVAQGIDFLGYRIWPGHKLLRRSSVIRAKRKIRQATQHDDLDYLASFIAAWKGHADLADSVNLRWWLEREHDVAHHLRLARKARRKNRDDLLDDLLS